MIVLFQNYAIKSLCVEIKRKEHNCDGKPVDSNFLVTACCFVIFICI